jgi:hypothetical protein
MTTSAYTTDSSVVEVAVGGFVEPVGRRSSYTASRLAILADGTTKPVLLILAEALYTSWDEDKFPFWVNGSRFLESASNVGLATRATGTSATRRRRTRSTFGVPSGTKEYMKLWRAAHKENVRTSQRKYVARLTNLVQAVQASSRPSLEDTPDVFAALEAAVASSEDVD